MLAAEENSIRSSQVICFWGKRNWKNLSKKNDFYASIIWTSSHLVHPFELNACIRDKILKAYDSLDRSKITTQRNSGIANVYEFSKCQLTGCHQNSHNVGYKDFLLNKYMSCKSNSSSHGC